MKLPKEGGWIMIRTLIPVEIPIDPLSIYFAKAKPHIIQAGYSPKKELQIWAIIHTPWGDVTIREEEYSVVAPERMAEYFEAVKEGGAFMKHYNKDNKNIESQRLADGIFYLRSRGVSYGDALGMCLGLIDSYDILYIEFHVEYQRLFCRNLEQYLERKQKFFADREAGIPYMEHSTDTGSAASGVKKKKRTTTEEIEEHEEKLRIELAEYLGLPVLKDQN